MEDKRKECKGGREEKEGELKKKARKNESGSRRENEREHNWNFHSNTLNNLFQDIPRKL